MAASNPYHGLAKLGRVQLPSGTTYALIDYNGRELIAPIFSAEASYEVGDYVIYEDNLYRFTADHAAGAWDAADVGDTLTISDEIKRLESTIVGGIHYRGKTTSGLYEGATTNPIVINGVSYDAEQGDMVSVKLSDTALTYATATAYNANTYIKNGDIYYITTDAITASENTSFTAIEGKCNIVKGDPEFIYDGSTWGGIGSVDGLGDLAFKDKASGTYTAPTGSGTVTVDTVTAPTKKSLSTTSITGVSGTESVSKMTAGTAVDVAKAGTAVRYGTANVGAAVTYGTANKASSATTVGNANVGTAVTYGNANVGSAVTVATAGSATIYGTANVGAAVTYGTANPGTAVTGVAQVGSSKTFTTSGVTTSVSGDCLTFTTSGTDSVIGIADTTGVSITPAVASNTTLTPAVAAPSTQTLIPVGDTTDITPAVTSTLTLTPAVASTTTIYGAVDSSSTLTPAVAAPNDQTIVPAVSNGTITPWTEAAKTVAVAASSATTVATGSLEDGSQLVVDINTGSETRTVTVGTTSATVEVRQN